MPVVTGRGDVQLVVVGDILDMLELTEALFVPLELAQEDVVRGGHYPDLITPADKAHWVTGVTPGCTGTAGSGSIILW